LKGLDYGSAGAYFVTVCLEGRVRRFGEVVDGQMLANQAGGAVAEAWRELPRHHASVRPDEAIVMPDHLHGILWLDPPEGGHGGPPLRGLALSAVMNRFKSWTTRIYAQGVSEAGWEPFDRRLWQRSYFDRVIRDDRTLEACRRYIRDNPTRWTARSRGAS
jgi:REP element-mobilizing transposase RayT